MPFEANIVQSIHMLQRGGNYFVPADSGNGMINRPHAHGEQGGNVATLETMFDYYINNVPNPNEAKRMDPDIENKIRTHPDVVAAYRKRMFTVASMPWRIDPNPNAPPEKLGAAKEIAKHVSDVWAKIPRLTQLYAWLQYAVLVGGQGLEFTWHRDAAGVEYPVSFQPVHMSRFVFDRLGNMALLTRDQPVWGVYVSSDPQAVYKRIMPRGKFAYHIYMQGQATWERPDLGGYFYYGIGEDISLYYTVTFDFFVWRFRMKWLEKYGLPPTALYYPENRLPTGEVLRVCDSLRSESIISMPRSVGTDQEFDSLYKIEQLPIPSMTQDAFAEYQKNYTKPHVDSILLGSAEEGQKTEGKGGYSDHVSRKDSGPNIWFRWDAGNINETLNTQIMPAIVLGRYPNCPPELWPVHVLEPKEEKDRAQEMQIIESVTKIVPVAEDYVYDASGVPRPQPTDKTVGGMQQPGGFDDGLGMPPDAQSPQGLGVGKTPPGGAPGLPKMKAAIGMGSKPGAGAVSGPA